METVLGFLNHLASKGVRLSVEAGQLNCYAQKGMLTSDIRDGILKYRSEIISLLESRATRLQVQCTEFPLSAGEKGLYLLQSLHPGMTAYNVPICFKITSPLDTKRLAQAWSHVLDQFPILTARVIEKDGVPYHRLDPKCHTGIRKQTVDFPDNREFHSFLRKQVKQPFDLNRGPLTRIDLFLREKQSPVLLLTVHHIVFDGTSAVIVLRSLFELYQQLCEGRPVRRSQELHGYHEFVAWEEAMLASAEGAGHRAYWQKQLEGELPALELLPDLSRAAAVSFEGRTLVEDLPENVSRWVREFAKAHSLPPSVVFLAVFQLLLHRHTNQDDIIVGMPVMGRAAQQFAGEVGYFINMVPLRAHCGGPIKLLDFLRKVHGTMLDALYHSSYPFPLMLESTEARSSVKNPIFQVSYAYQNFAKPTDFAFLLGLQALQLESVDEIWQEGDFDLGLEIFEDPASAFIVHLKYNPELYAAETIAGIFERYCVLLTAVIEDPKRFTHEYPILARSEQQKLLVDFNETRAEYPTDQCLHELFIGQVASYADETAVLCDGELLTYQELYARSRDLAWYLQSLGVEPDRLVGVCMDRSPDMVVGLLGILQAGGAYVPLDPNYPDERLAHMLRDSRAAVVLTQERLWDKLAGLVSPKTRLVAMDREWPEIREQVARLRANEVPLHQDVKPYHLSHVIYTSGSTGQPKGVAIEHHSPVTLVHWASQVYSREELAGVLASTSICFDLSVYEIFVTLANGGTIFLVPNALGLVDLPKGTPVTLINTVPSAIEELVRLGAIPDSVRTINLAGELLSAALVARIYDTTSAEKVYDLYGPSEDTTYSTYSLRQKGGRATIGRPIANTQVYILDRHNQIQAVGVPGELCIAGDGLARGYLNRPELTEEKFVANPFDPGTRMYKTGDLARWLDDGTLQYLGRIDTQVKIRGFRIEMGEIETRLNQHSEIQDCAVIAQGQDAGKQLIAFYRAKDTTADHIVDLPYDELRAHLSRTLPDYMIPAAFASLAVIPLNPNGKVDRRALMRMDVTIGSGRHYVAPRNETEQRLVAIWAEVLNRTAETIGIHDNFFEAGGHSLLATQLISKIRSRMDVDVPLKTLFERGTVEGLAELIATAKQSEIPPIERVDRTKLERLPLSFAQERLWFIHQLEPESAGYNVPGAVTIRGELDIDQLEQAFNRMIERHENLRTVFPSEEGRPHQRVLDRMELALERIDVTHYATTEARENAARQLCQSDAATPFDLAAGPLIRGKVVKLADDEHILMLNMHHIISDGWSQGVLIRELGVIVEALREGREPELAPLPIQYVDYSVWQRRWLEESGILEQQLAYWQNKLAGVAETLDLATDYPRPSVRSFAGANQAFALDAQLSGQLKRLAEQQGSTLYMVLLAAFKTLLHRYTGQNDIRVGSPIANRQYGETEGLIGMFVNILAMRSQVESDDTFAALLARVKETCLEAYEHQDTPFERVVDLLQPQRNLAISPLFQVTLTLQNTDMGAPDPAIERYPLHSGISKFDLGVELAETTEGLAGSIEYSTALYKPQTIARMAAHFEALCRAITAAPSARIGDLGYLSEAEKHTLLVEFNDTDADYPKDRCLHQLFIEQAERHPEQTAVVCGEEHLTYGQLYARSQDLALVLQHEGVGPDGLVGLCMERSLEMVVSLLGILQAGGAYVPLDPDYPEERLAYMLRDSRAAVVLTQERLQDKLRTLIPAETRLIALDQQRPQIAGRVAALKAEGVQLQQRVEPSHLAYVIYTSGSTGLPKGVMNEHRGVVNRLLWMQDAYGLQMDEALLQKTPFSFDVSVWEFFWPLLAGSTLVMARPEGHKDPGYLVDTIRRNRITTMHFVPPMLQVFLEHAGASQCSSLRRVICSGEALPSMLVKRFAERLPNATLYNLYGPTEAAVDVTEWTCPSENVPTIIPIGRPIANTQIHVLDRQGELVPIGVAGELHIAGIQVARGYLNRPELTAERFVRDPFSGEPGARMYKTGDLARWLDDGTVEYLGRNDFQVKIRGFRIELGEIEARLMTHEGVREAVVVAREDTPGDKRLVAYYTPSPRHAFPVAQLLRLRKTEAGAAAKYSTLPNGLAVFQQNQSETEFVYDEIFADDGYLRHGVTLNDGDCVFDVGANIGLFSLFVGQRYRNTTIYAFEPIPQVFQTLQLNAALHGWAGRVYECGLADTSKQEVFTFYPHNTVISSSSTSPGEAREIVRSYLLNRPNGDTVVGETIDELLEARLESESYTCQLRTISEIVEENGIEKIDLLKIDVEKAERDVLAGIQDCDWPKIRQLVIEVHDVSGRLGEIVVLLEGRGYQVTHEQSRSLEDTTLHNVYAFRPAPGNGRIGGNGVGMHQAAEASWGSPESLHRDVRAFLSEHLPEYMVPAAYVPLGEMPLTPNGKLDRKALPAPEERSAAAAYEPPQGEIEETLAAIWQELLHVERVGRNDDFFELGGHSLLATQLISKIRGQLGVDLPLKAVFERTSVAGLSELIATAEKTLIPAILPVDRTKLERLPLSFAQERLWFIDQLEPESAGYNVPGAVTIRGELDIDQLEQAFNRMIERHENLRTVFPSEEGRPHQRVLDRMELALERIDLSGYDEGVRELEAMHICQTDAATPFDLAAGPLIRGKVIELAGDEHILMLNLHHIISDGWSHGILVQELAAIMEALREGREPELAPLPIQYVDYSVWQRRWLEEGGILERQLGYWQKKLAGVPQSLDLPTDYRRPSVRSFAGATCEFAVPAQLSGQLKRLAEQQGGTLYMVLLAAFKVLLHRYTGQNDICVGSPIANRQYGETEGVIGMFVNTLAMRSQVEGDDTFATLLSKVKATCLEAYEHQDAPFEKVVDLVSPQRNLAMSPLFQVMVILQNAGRRGERDGRIQNYPLESGISKFDLTVEFAETSEGLAAAIRYSTALYKPETIDRMVEHFMALCRAITLTPAAKIGDLDYIGQTEKQQLLSGYNESQAEYPRDKCIHELFAEQVALHPDRTAVVFGEEKLSYQELYDKSRDLAIYLQSQGVRADGLVGLTMDRSLEMMVGVLGILQAGGAYVPLDPDYPAERLQHILEDAAPAIVLTQERFNESLPKTAAQVIALDSEWTVIERQARTRGNQHSVEVRPDHLAYVIYTSGSTGLPKGVMVQHGSLTNYLVWVTGLLESEGIECLPVVTNLSFDASLKQIFGPLMTGRTVVLAEGVSSDPEGLLRTLEQESGTGLNCVPSLWRMLLDLIEKRPAGTMGNLRGLLLGGEEIPQELIRRSLQRIPELKIVNLYGPTEATANATFARRISVEDRSIGRPVANTQIYILDGRGQLVPVGVAGEIHIGGVGVARGYLNRPELTAERFIADPFRADPQARLYKSGDVGRWRADGNIEYLGRNDQQVKLRGHRIELGEIEAQLSKHPGVKEAVVIAREDEPGEKRLVAYVTRRGEALEVEDLRAHLLTSVPQYMVPAAFVELEALPLTPSRKVDRNALPRPEAQAYASKEFEPPQGEIEETLAAIWQDLLHVERVGRNDDFFECGGHSLSAVQLMAKINRHFEQLLPLSVMFTAPTIADLAKLISNQTVAPGAILIPIQTNGDAPPVFAVPGAGGNVLSLQPLSRTMGAKQPFYGLQAVGLDGKTPPLSSVEETARLNIAAMQTVQPRGPYRLVGHSYGGVVAFEMARLLSEQGEAIASLSLLDSLAPSVMQGKAARDETAELYAACTEAATLYDARVEIDIDGLRELLDEEKVQYLVGRLNDGGMEINAEQFDAFYRVYRANQHCYRTYKPSPLPREVEASLYRATQGHQDVGDLPRDYGWSALLQSPIRTHDVEADHFSIVGKCIIADQP